MASCKDCIHESVCYSLIKMGLPYMDEKYPAEKFCLDFKNKADVVEVVRCKDCKHSSFVKSCSKYECRKGCGTLKYCNDFCSYGERRETK